MGIFCSPEVEKARDRENADAAEGVTLWQVLDVDERCIPLECRVAMLKIPYWWNECGRPAGKVSLSVFLHHVLNRCVQDGIRYPKVVLKRLKQMQRGEWKPGDHSRAAIMRRGGFQRVGEFLRGGRDDWQPRTAGEAMDD